MAMPHLLYVWPSLSQRLRDADQVLLLFDYDGTLTPIVEQPSAAVLSPAVKQRLAGLAAADKFVVGVVTGRSLSDIAARVAIPDLIYAGNHGLEIQGQGLDFVHETAAELAPVQERIEVRLREEMTGLPGVIIQPKGLSLSVHYRMTPDSRVKQVEDTFASVVAPFVESALVRTTTGKKSWRSVPTSTGTKARPLPSFRNRFPKQHRPCSSGTT